jgi:hypothetical protein
MLLCFMDKLHIANSVRQNLSFIRGIFKNTVVMMKHSPAWGYSLRRKFTRQKRQSARRLKQMYGQYETCHKHRRTVARLATETKVLSVCRMPQASANDGAAGNRNKSMNQYGACHAVEYRSPPRRSRRRSSWPACKLRVTQLTDIFTNRFLVTFLDSSETIFSFYILLYTSV